MFRILLILALLLAPTVALANGGTGFSIPNPLGSEDLGQLLNRLTQGILRLAVPVAALMYIYAGYLWLTAGARPSHLEDAKKVFKYTTIGLIVIFIGGGFVNLIQSILELG